MVLQAPGWNLAGEAGKRAVPWLLAVAFFMEALDTTILNTAVPVVARALGVPPLSMKAVLASYTLSLAVFIPISGWVADRFGTRRVFAMAIAAFTMGSLLCGLATNIHMLVACRVLQGCGGAMMLPVGRLTLVRTFARSELLRAMSFVAIPGLVGPMLGPLAGGLVITYFHWRWIFFVNLPFGIIGLWVAWHYLPDYQSQVRRPLDITGVILFGSGISLLSYVLEIFGEHTLRGAEIGGLFGISFVLIGGYALHALRTPQPLLQFSLFRGRTFRLAVTGSFLTRLGVGGVPFLLPLLYQVGFGFSPVQSGLLMMPQALAALSLKMSMPRLLRRFGHRRILITNTVLIGVMLMLLATVQLDTPLWRVILQVFFFGFLNSLQYTSMNTLVYADVVDEQASWASTIASTVQQMSLSFGVAVASMATALFIPDRFHCTAEQMITGLHQAFILLGAITIGTALVFTGLEPHDGAAVSQHT